MTCLAYISLCGMALLGLAVVPRLALRAARRWSADTRAFAAHRRERERLIGLLDDERRARDAERCPECFRTGKDACPCNRPTA